jgi:hypothetical protein
LVRIRLCSIQGCEYGLWCGAMIPTGYKSMHGLCIYWPWNVKSRSACNDEGTRLDKLILIQIQLPEHPFALIVAQSRALGRPAAIAKLIDRPKIAFAVRVAVLIESVIGFDQFADAGLIGRGQGPETDGCNGGASNPHRASGKVVQTCNPRRLPARCGNGTHCTRPLRVSQIRINAPKSSRSPSRSAIFRTQAIGKPFSLAMPRK